MFLWNLKNFNDEKDRNSLSTLEDTFLLILNYYSVGLLTLKWNFKVIFVHTNFCLLKLRSLLSKRLVIFCLVRSVSRSHPHSILFFFEGPAKRTKYFNVTSCNIIDSCCAMKWRKERWYWRSAHRLGRGLTLYTLTSAYTISILFSIHFLRCWQGEFV